MQVILFNTDAGVAILMPALNIGLSLVEIGKKDVPKGVPFWIADTDELPMDKPTEAWVIDESTAGAPTGYGGRA